MTSLSSRLEQEIHERNLNQSELKMQNQQVSVMRSSEKALKQEINHLLDIKDDLESQSQELRRFKQTTVSLILLNKKGGRKHSFRPNCQMGFERTALGCSEGSLASSGSSRD